MNEDEKRLLAFLDHICLKLGFCLPKSTRHEISRGGPYSADQIAGIVLEKEGLNPDGELRHFRDIRNEYTAFIERI